LRVQAGQRQTLDSIHGTPENDGGCAAVFVGRDFQDGYMPQESTVKDIMETYIEGWKLGVKAVAIYRDGSKRSQP